MNAKSIARRGCLFFVLFGIACFTVRAAEALPLRPPAVPLVVHDPFFSIWSAADKLTDAPTTHWTRHPHRLTSLVRIDGKTFRLMGDEPKEVDALPQVGLQVLPTRTIYTFANADISLTLTFTSPVLPDELSILSRPVTYLTWSVRSVNGASHAVSVYFDAASEIAVNTPDEKVVWRNETIPGLAAERVGTEAQNILNLKGDDVRINWGYLYLASPAGEKATQAITASSAAANEFISTGRLGGEVDGDAPKAVNAGAPVLAQAIDLGDVSGQPVSRYAMLAYDEVYSIDYFWTKLRPYWRKDGAQAPDLLQAASRDYDSLQQRCANFDREFVADLTAAGGTQYAQMGALAYRQAFGGNGLAADAHGQPLFFPKENTSNGCMATTDVVMPMSPLFYLFGPTMARAMILPEMDYGSSDRWSKTRPDWAPHDVGKYPIADYPAYGDMPVEESGNMLIMVGVLTKLEGNADFASAYWPTLKAWVEYLQKFGTDPQFQLCTDDFMGPSPHNANLAIKAIMGIASYGYMCQVKGDAEEGAKYLALARADALTWMKTDADGDHYRLQFDKPDSWSMKYNLVWDKILGLGIFPPEVAEKELAYYKTKIAIYGAPLDSRTTLGDVDHMFFTATLATQPEDFQTFVGPFYDYLNQTTVRYPLADTYHTQELGFGGLHARPVVGGIFSRVLADPALWKKWAARDQTKAHDWAPLPSEQVTPVLAAGDTDAQGAVWSYTTQAPADDSWQQPAFGDAAWDKKPAGFGNAHPVRAEVRTVWSTPDIWMRRSFTMPSADTTNLRLWSNHAQGIVVYLNGVLAYERPLNLDGYDAIEIRPEALATLKPGQNTLAVHSHYGGKPGGRQFVDVGLVRYPASP